MKRLLSVAFCCALLAGQEAGDLFRKAPPEVDAALRGRINKFFQAHVDGKFRQAEALVAEDTKDFFYNSNKPRYLSFEIKSIDYSDNFTRARATIIGEMTVPIMGFADKPMKIPFPAYWKIENGEWFWYVDEEMLRRTPFGVMKPGGKPGSGGLPASLPDTKSIMEQVKVDKSSIRLLAGRESSDQIVISNAMPGPISVTVAGTAAGLTVSPQSFDLKAAAKETIRFTASEGNHLPAGGFGLEIRTQPLNQVFPVQVLVDPAR